MPAPSCWGCPQIDTLLVVFRQLVLAIDADSDGSCLIVAAQPSFHMQGTMSARFLRHEGFLGAVGAFLKVHPMTPPNQPASVGREPRKVTLLGLRVNTRLTQCDRMSRTRRAPTRCSQT